MTDLKKTFSIKDNNELNTWLPIDNRTLSIDKIQKEINHMNLNT